jgi:hypothetical protein
MSTGDWPPASFADNDHILVWWLPEYDDALRELIAKWQWAWIWQIHDRLEQLIPETVIRAWRQSDPLCHEYAWYNVLWNFARARAKQLGLAARSPQQKTCPICGASFQESDLPSSVVDKVGVDGLNCCRSCFTQALMVRGSVTSSNEDILAVLQSLRRALNRAPLGRDLEGRLDFQSLSNDSRLLVIRALRVKPTTARVKELFGSWDAAVEVAASHPPLPLPEYRHPLPARTGEFVSGDPARYRDLVGSLPEVDLDPARETWTYHQEISALIGTGYLALAEAALLKLCERDYLFYEPLARVYGETARTEDAQKVIATLNQRLVHDQQPERNLEYLLAPRDLRTISCEPIFYRPLTTTPQGRAHFVFLGGPMAYVDRRGEHECVTGDQPKPIRPTAQFEESVARVNAMVESEAWLRAAIGLGQSIQLSETRRSEERQAYGLVLCYAPGSLRGVVKSLTGSAATKWAPEQWRIGTPGRAKWAYHREGDHYIWNANADFALIAVDAPPTVCVWAWPDRSDLCLQALLDTIACSTSSPPVTMILPDVPDLRDFARRYVRGEVMAKAERALLEDFLYRSPAALPNKRGLVLSADFGPQLVVQPDGQEDAGRLLASGLAYLDARHTLRFSIWDLLDDALLRNAASATTVTTTSFALSDFDRDHMVEWYAQLPEYDDPSVLLRPYRPSLLAGLDHHE